MRQIIHEHKRKGRDMLMETHHVIAINKGRLQIEG